MIVYKNWLKQIHCKRKFINPVFSFCCFAAVKSVSKYPIVPVNSHIQLKLNPFHALDHTELDRNRNFCSSSRSRRIYSVIPCEFGRRMRLNPIHILAYAQTVGRGNFLSNSSSGSLFSLYSTKAPARSLRRRISNRKKLDSTPVLDESKFQQAISQLPPRFTPEELFNVITLQEDPLVCSELFKWASQQPRFKHDVCTYHITIRKLGAAKMYQEMDEIVNQVLSVHQIGNENLYNSIVYYFTRARKLTRAVNVFKHMRSSTNLDCRPTIRTYQILFKALLSRGTNSEINFMYMETISSLFKQMVEDGIEPDVFALNCMIKGYVLSLHVNDALRIFHQMDPVYGCQPNSYSYDYLIHGLCAQGRTVDAKEMCNEMKTKRFVPSSKSYNSLVNAFALSGDVNEAVSYLRETIGSNRMVDFITYKTVVEEFNKRGNHGEALRLLKMLREKGLVDGDSYKKLTNVLRD